MHPLPHFRNTSEAAESSGGLRLLGQIRLGGRQRMNMDERERAFLRVRVFVTAARTREGGDAIDRRTRPNSPGVGRREWRATDVLPSRLARALFPGRCRVARSAARQGSQAPSSVPDRKPRFIAVSQTPRTTAARGTALPAVNLAHLALGEPEKRSGKQRPVMEKPFPGSDFYREKIDARIPQKATRCQ